MTTPPDPLERHGPALLLWARAQTPDWVRAKLDPADLVQQTLLEGVRAADRLAGLPDHEALAYLRRALANNLIDAARRFARARHDLSPDTLSASSGRMADWLAAADTSPSERADRNERFARLADGLARLPGAQRVAVEMRYFQGMRVGDIAAALGRSEGAVSLLLHRAVAALREDLGGPDAP